MASPPYFGIECSFFLFRANATRRKPHTHIAKQQAFLPIQSREPHLCPSLFHSPSLSQHYFWGPGGAHIYCGLPACHHRLASTAQSHGICRMYHNVTATKEEWNWTFCSGMRSIDCLRKWRRLGNVNGNSSLVVRVCLSYGRWGSWTDVRVRQDKLLGEKGLLSKFKCNLHTYHIHYRISKGVHQEARVHVIVLNCLTFLNSSMSSFALLTDSSFPMAFPNSLPAASLALFSYCDGDLCRRPLAIRSRYAFVSPAFTGRFQNLGGKPHYSTRCINTVR